MLDSVESINPFLDRESSGAQKKNPVAVGGKFKPKQPSPSRQKPKDAPLSGRSAVAAETSYRKIPAFNFSQKGKKR